MIKGELQDFLRAHNVLISLGYNRKSSLLGARWYAMLRTAPGVCRWYWGKTAAAAVRTAIEDYQERPF